MCCPRSSCGAASAISSLPSRILCHQLTATVDGPERTQCHHPFGIKRHVSASSWYSRGEASSVRGNRSTRCSDDNVSTALKWAYGTWVPQCRFSFPLRCSKSTHMMASNGAATRVHMVRKHLKHCGRGAMVWGFRLQRRRSHGRSRRLAGSPEGAFRGFN